MTNRQGSMPKHVLNLINEHALGGFVLYYFNSENGHPEHIMFFESPAHCLALQKYIGDWSEGLKQASIEASKHSIQALSEGEEDEEDE